MLVHLCFSQLPKPNKGLSPGTRLRRKSEDRGEHRQFPLREGSDRATTSVTWQPQQTAEYNPLRRQGVPKTE